MKNKQRIIVIIVMLFLSSILFSSVYAEENRFEASLERDNVSLGNPLYLYLTFYGSQDAGMPAMPTIEGLKIKFIGPSTKISVVNGQMSQSVTYTFLVIPQKAGEYRLGPFFSDYKGQTYKTNVLTLTVNGVPTGASRGGSSSYSSAARASAQPSISRSSSNRHAQQNMPSMDDRVFLTMDVPKGKVYVNEILPVTIKVYVNNVGLKDIQYPNYPHEGFSVGEYNEPERRAEIIRGVRYDTLVFKQNIFGIKEGKYILGPAKLGCKVVVRTQSARRRASIFGIDIFDEDFSGMMGGYKTYPVELTAEEIPVTILPFPSEGRPSDFQGAVGDFSMDVYTKPAKVKVGDPVVVRMIIGGDGNLDTVSAPNIVVGDDIKTYEPQVTKEDGKKIYEQILIPKSDKVKQIPEIRFSFFNPKTGKYKTISKGPFSLNVVKQPKSEQGIKMVSVPGEEYRYSPPEEFGKDIIHIKDSIGRMQKGNKFIYNNFLFWVLQVVPLVFFFGFYFNHRKRERMLKDKGYARFLKAPKKARKGLAKAKSYLDKKDLPEFYDAIFKTLQNYLAGKFNLPMGSVTVQLIEKKLASVGYDDKKIEMLREIFSKCEMARYASSALGDEGAKELLQKVRKIIDSLEKVRI